MHNIKKDPYFHSFELIHNLLTNKTISYLIKKILKREYEIKTINN